MKKEKFTEYGGFVKNEKTGEYDLLFVSRVNSAALMRRFAIDVANEQNSLCCGKYNVDNVIIKSRQKTITTGNWTDFTDDTDVDSEENLEKEIGELKKILEDSTEQ